MALSAYQAVWERSKATGNARLTLLALAEHVNEQRIKAGYPWEAWPSQSTLAAMCGCSRSTIQLALEKLVEQGEIADTGDRRRRGTIAWEIVLDAPDLTDSESGHDHLTDSRSGGERRGDDLTDSRDDLTDLHPDLTDSRHRPDRRVGNEPEVEPEDKPEALTGSAPSAADRALSSSSLQNGNGNSPSLADDQSDEQQHVGERERLHAAAERREAEAELAELREQLPGKAGPLADTTRRCIEQLEADLASPTDLAAQAGVELQEAS